MANKKNKQKQVEKIKNNKDNNSIDFPSNKLKIETTHTIWAIIFSVLAIFFSLAAFKLAGRAGRGVYEVFHFLFGYGYSLLPLLMVLLAYSYFKAKQPKLKWINVISSLLFLLSSLGMMDVASGDKHSGGFLGKILSSPLVFLFEKYASILFLGAILIISILLIFDARPKMIPLFYKFLNLFRKKKTEVLENSLTPAEISNIPEEKEEDKTEVSNSEKVKNVLGLGKKKDEILENEEELSFKKLKQKNYGNYVPPPLSLLEEDKGKPNTGDIKGNLNIIKRTLANFGIEVEMDEVTIGPTVTRYALKPAEGVKLSRIVGLQNDLALALAAHPIRIEAPIPGKSLVGIEIPNKTKSTVGLATLLNDEKFQNSNKALTIALGRGISGKAMFSNLAKMPHCLVAGTTGSGKSVTIHSMITSLLYRNSPDDLKLIMIDPKRVELTLYNKIPHLLTPVITDAKKTILALKWAAKEMDRRYDILEAESVRDIESYHNNILTKDKKKNHKNEAGEEIEIEADRMPYIVIIIDELADIMTTYPRELEAGIVRLAQMSRAVGIHLILSTQRPEVNIITGLIKANIPARIALKVSSQIDSRTILDAGGAEKLLGAGDMLYSSGQAQPERLQSAFISETEVKKVVKYLADAYVDEITDEINLTSGSISMDSPRWSHGEAGKSIFESTLDDKNDEEDELYGDAYNCIVEGKQASTSYLQRKLRIGYARAARLMDMLEERGVIGAPDGQRKREILIGGQENQNSENENNQDNEN